MMTTRLYRTTDDHNSEGKESDANIRDGNNVSILLVASGLVMYSSITSATFSLSLLCDKRHHLHLPKRRPRRNKRGVP